VVAVTVTGQEIVDAAYELLGAPYRLWQPGMSLPTWLDDWRGDPPPASHLMAMGVECADLVAWSLARNGLSYPYQAGTSTFGDFLVNTSNFDPSTPGESGAVALKPYAGPAWADQGHIAIYVDEQTLIQAIARGVTNAWTDTETWGWGGSTEFTIYGYLPGVDYSGQGGGNGTKQNSWYIAVTRQGWLQLNGSDWSGGWWDSEWAFHQS
jgi:hypothetical protein